MRTAGRARRGTRANTACRWLQRVVHRDARHRGQRVRSRLSGRDWARAKLTGEGDITMPTPVIPQSLADLLQRPLYAHLATVRPDGTPQVNPTWFRFDGEYIW